MTMTTPSQAEKCVRFEQLHQQDDVFLIPNPWDIGSARLLQGMGYEALATTSSGFAHTLGRPDGLVTLEEKLQHCRALSEATTIPINADFENGFADDPEGVAINVRRVIHTGIAGCSIEDYDRDRHVIYSISESVERVRAAAEVVASFQMPFQLTARAENLLRGVDDLGDTIKRLHAYAAAGANVLYAPGIRSLHDLQRVTEELDRPFNVLAPLFSDATVQDFATAGAKRISMGGALNWISVAPLIRAGKEMLEQGSFFWTEDLASSGEVRKYLEQEI